MNGISVLFILITSTHVNITIMHDISVHDGEHKKYQFPAVMVGWCNATFNNISVIMWRSVLLVEETPKYQEKTTDLLQVTDKLYQKSEHFTMTGS
jgi:hypothetical protein